LETERSPEFQSKRVREAVVRDTERDDVTQYRRN